MQRSTQRARAQAVARERRDAVQPLLAGSGMVALLVALATVFVVTAPH